MNNIDIVDMEAYALAKVCLKFDLWFAYKKLVSFLEFHRYPSGQELANIQLLNGIIE